VEFWSEQNAKSELALRETMNELGALREEKESQSLQAMDATLDKVSHFLPKRLCGDRMTMSLHIR
jgi:hypothetical protein